jgi:serine/threonine-protein kinase
MTSIAEALKAALDGRYMIEQEIGAGGMATVYVAQDVKHDRKVALKVLRPELAAVIGGERFLAEIKVTANLQHPHILPLHDSGEADSFLYYVMPYVEGETLRDKIEREKQLGVDDAVGITRSVAAALDYAHRQKVIHRDIKPENILLHDGQPLIADFGIALALSHAGGTRLTETGLSIGTPHYMSPEQAMGDRELDARSDVYSLGAMLYEMLAGDPPYTGSTAQAIVAKVITEKAPSVTVHRDTAPVHVAAAITKALAKLPADRFASAGDFAEALTKPGLVATVSHPEAAPSAATGRRDWRLFGLAGALVLAVAIAAAGWLQALKRPASPVQRFELAVASEYAIPPLFGTPIDIAPDGQQYAFVGPGERNRQLWLRTLDRLEPVALGGTEGAMSPRMSPDGRWIAFVADQRVKKVPVTGGPPITLADSANSTLPGMAWLDDGNMLFVHGNWGLYRMPSAGGTPSLVAVRDSGQGGYFFPDGLPGSRQALVTSCSPSCGTMEIIVMNLADGSFRTLIEDAARAWYLPTGHIAYANREGAVFAAPFDADRAEITGAAVPVAEGVRTQIRIVPEMAISASGSLIYRRGAAGGLTLAWTDLRGVSTDIDPEWAGFFGVPALSPDGRQAAVALSAGSSQDIWVKALDRGPASRLSFEGSFNERPVWTPDGRRVGYISNREGGIGPKRAIARRADGGGQDEVLLEHPLGVEEFFWSSDGRWLVARVGGTDGVRDIVGLRLGVDSVLQELVATPADEFAPALSPDDRWLAYVSTESGQSEVLVVPFPNTGDARWQVSVRGGNTPVWSPDGSRLYYVDGSGDLMVAAVASHNPFAVGQQEMLFSASAFSLDAYHPSFAVHPSGERLILTKLSAQGAEANLILVQNWFEEIEGRFKGER